MKLQVASRIAIYAVLELAANPEHPMSVAEIGEKCGASTHHLAKVLHALGRAGLVSSVRGAGGGYQFVGNAKRTTLLDVIGLFETIGPSPIKSVEPGEGTAAHLALREILNEIDEIAIATLSSITISTMLKMMHRAPDPEKVVQAL
jgi:Rrf2 family nitric oxide-sensitive transcriptional repressor